VSGSRAVRVTVTIPAELLAQLDELARRSFKSRSSAVAEAIKRLIDSMSFDARGLVIGVISYQYGGHRVAERLRELGHRYRDVVVSALHFHVGEDRCLEVVIVKGEGQRVEGFVRELGKVKGIERLSVALSRATEPP